MKERHRFCPDLDQSRLEPRTLLAGTPPILPFLINGSTFGPYMNAGFAMFGMPGGGSSSMMGAAPGLPAMNGSGSLVSGPTTTTANPIAGGATTVVATVFAAGAPVGSGANRAGGGAVGYGSRFASGYNFGLNATNAYGSSTSAQGTSLPLGSSGVAMTSRSGTPRNPRPGQRMENERLRFRQPPPPAQDTQPADSQEGSLGESYLRAPAGTRLRVAPRESRRNQ